MAEQKIELRKVRDFSENLNDTFLFIRQNFKPLIITFLGVAGAFMLAAAVVQGFYQNEMGGIFEEILKGTGSPGVMPTELFTSTYMLVGLFAWINLIAMRVVLIAYVKVYDTKEGSTPTMNEVWDEFKKYFLKVLLYSLPVLILIFIGFVCCIAPGVYFWVLLVPFETVMMVENKGFSESFSRCYVLLKDNFWLSFGIYLITYIIYSFMTGIIGGIVALLSGVISWFTTNDISTTVNLVTSILNIFSFVFYIVFMISAILNYYSLAEKYDGTGILKRLNNLGGSNKNYNNVEEQY